jgi:hypothetical protein
MSQKIRKTPENMLWRETTRNEHSGRCPSVLTRLAVARGYGWDIRVKFWCSDQVNSTECPKKLKIVIFWDKKITNSALAKKLSSDFFL